MKVWLVVAVVILCSSPVPSQEYLWPTDASRNLTSSFAESRPRRFHAGIDIKTWARTGYKIFATRSGYIERMRVSPFGYGRALYLRLDTGEIAVYAHLSRFNDKLQAIAEREQERRVAYRINKYFKPWALPVEKGEIHGLNGQTGIGVPHLHFELRDAHNRPINPLAKDFPVVDTIPPVVTSVAISPLEPGAMVDGDYKPQFYKPVESNGQWVISEPIRAAGKIGFAVAAYDRANGVRNRFSVYRYRLYVDGSLQFQSQTDRFAFSQNKLIELAQEYALARRGAGRHHKLYRELANTLSIYSNLNASNGALVIPAQGNGRHAGVEPRHVDDSTVENPAYLDAGLGLKWGPHDFRIVLEDFYGNATTVHGRLLAGSPFALHLPAPEILSDRIVCRQVSASDGREIKEVKAYVANGSASFAGGAKWTEVPARMSPSQPAQHSAPLESLSDRAWGHESTRPEGETKSLPATELVVHHRGARIVRLVAVDEYGIESFPAFLALDSTFARDVALTVKAIKDFHRDYLRVVITANLPLQQPPYTTLITGSRRHHLEVVPRDSNQYVGVIPLPEISSDSVWLAVSAQSLDGQRASWMEVFGNASIEPGQRGALRASDDRMRVRFLPASLYWPIYGRVVIDSSRISDARVIGPIYVAEPRDEPLSNYAVVEISYPDTVAHPEKLGVCYHTGRKWAFIDNRADTETRTISARVYSLEKFALIRDDVPPVLEIRVPAAGDTVRDRRPRFEVFVDDETSGFESERAITLELDGTFLISEYDPETKTVSYRPKSDLPAGSHRLTATARDRCGNVRRSEAEFVVF